MMIKLLIDAHVLRVNLLSTPRCGRRERTTPAHRTSRVRSKHTHCWSVWKAAPCWRAAVSQAACPPSPAGCPSRLTTCFWCGSTAATQPETCKPDTPHVAHTAAFVPHAHGTLPFNTSTTRTARARVVINVRPLHAGEHHAVSLSIVAPASHHSLALQVGCSDGSVAVWRLQPEAQASDRSTVPVTPVLLSHACCDPSPLRAMAWAPTALAAAAADGLGRAVYMAAGHQGALSIWDAR